MFTDDAQPPGPEWLRELIGVDYFAEVQKVDLQNRGVSDVTPLASLTKLEYLGLHGTDLGDLTPLAKLTNLKTLYLSCTPVFDLTPLGRLTRLEALHLVNPGHYSLGQTDESQTLFVQSHQDL